MLSSAQSGSARPRWRQPLSGSILLLVAIGALIVWKRPILLDDRTVPDQAVSPASSSPDVIGAASPTTPPVEGRWVSTPAQIIPTFTGTVDQVEGGSLYLRDVTYSLGPDQPKPDTTTEKVPVPDGRWVSDSHWQSTDGTVDLFRAQPVVYFIEHKVIMPDLHFIDGRVRKVKGDNITVEVQEFDDGAAESPQSVVTHVGQVVALHLTPHAKADPVSFAARRTIRPGDRVIIGWFGEPGTQLVWQVAFPD